MLEEILLWATGPSFHSVNSINSREIQRLNIEHLIAITLRGEDCVRSAAAVPCLIMTYVRSNSHHSRNYSTCLINMQLVPMILIYSSLFFSFPGSLKIEVSLGYLINSLVGLRWLHCLKLKAWVVFERECCFTCDTAVSLSALQVW